MKTIILKILPLFIILFSLFIRVPAIYMLNNSMVIGDDASLYIETAKNFAEGNGYCSSRLLHFSSLDETNKYITKNGVMDRMEWIPPLYIFLISILYIIAGQGWFILSINLFNLFLLAVFLLLYYKYLSKNYPENPLILNLSLLFIGLNFIIFEFNLLSHLESIYLLTFFIAFLQHIKILEKEKISFWDYLLYAVSLTLFLFSKYSAIPYVAAFLIHFLIRRKARSFIIASLLTFLFVSPWMFLRSYLISGHFISVQIRREHFPFSDSLPTYSGFANEVIYGIYSYFRDFVGLFNYFISYDGFYVIFPFVLIAVLEFKRKNILKETGLALLIACILFFGVIHNNPNLRYLFLIIIPLLPIGLLKMQELLKDFRYRKVIYILIISFFIWNQTFRITEYYNSARKSFKEITAKMQNAIELINSGNLDKEKIILANFDGINYYLDNPVVRMPDNITFKNKFEMINIYKVDYVLFVRGGENLSEDIFHDLNLIGKSKSDTTIKLYSVY